MELLFLIALSELLPPTIAPRSGKIFQMRHNAIALTLNAGIVLLA
jgi:hypothetical protein